MRINFSNSLEGQSDHLTKLKEMILYVSSKCEEYPNFGSIVLNKILFFADTVSYAQSGKSISGSLYRRQQMGPVPARFMPARQALIDEGLLKIENTVFRGRSQKRPVCTAHNKTFDLSSDEKNLIDEVVSAFCASSNPITGKRASDITHEHLSWKFFRDGEDIPYETIHFSTKPDFDANDLVWAQEELQKQNLL